MCVFYDDDDLSVCVLQMTMMMRTGGPVSEQPQPVGVSSETDEWSSGICDCCQEPRECTVQVSTHTADLFCLL